MQSIMKHGQLASGHESLGLSPFVFPMMVLFGTYTVWIVIAGILLFVLNVF